MFVRRRNRKRAIGFKRFYLNRLEDVHNISGTGRVAEGIQFGDGTVVLRWRSDVASTAVYNDLKAVVFLHGHNGRSFIEWVD